MGEEKESAYVTYQDVHGINSFSDQTVIILRAPPEAKLNVPDPNQVRNDMHQVRADCVTH